MDKDTQKTLIEILNNLMKAIENTIKTCEMLKILDLEHANALIKLSDRVVNLEHKISSRIERDAVLFRAKPVEPVGKTFSEEGPL